MERIFDCVYVLTGYLCGSVLFAMIATKLFRKKELFEQSADRNPGAANAFRYGGIPCGIFTLCGDLLKGFLPVFLLFHRAPNSVLAALILAAPVIGHIFPLFYGFKGGKGIATTFGCLLGLYPNLEPFWIFAAFFIFLSVGVRISPNYYRTLAAYLGTAAALTILREHAAVCIGFVLISAAVCLRLLLSKEEKERLRVRLLWMR